MKISNAVHSNSGSGESLSGFSEAYRLVRKKTLQHPMRETYTASGFSAAFAFKRVRRIPKSNPQNPDFPSCRSRNGQSFRIGLTSNSLRTNREAPHNCMNCRPRVGFRSRREREAKRMICGILSRGARAEARRVGAGLAATHSNPFRAFPRQVPMRKLPPGRSWRTPYPLTLIPHETRKCWWKKIRFSVIMNAKLRGRGNSPRRVTLLIGNFLE